MIFVVTFEATTGTTKTVGGFDIATVEWHVREDDLEPILRTLRCNGVTKFAVELHSGLIDHARRRSDHPS